MSKLNFVFRSPDLFPCYSKKEGIDDYRMKYLARYISVSDAIEGNKSLYKDFKNNQNDNSDISRNFSNRFSCYSDPDFRGDKILVSSASVNEFQNISSKHLEFCEEGLYSSI